MTWQQGAAGGAVLVVVVVLAVVFFVRRGQQPERPTGEPGVKVSERLGSHLSVDEKQPGKPVVGLRLDRTTVTDVDLRLLKELPSLQTLSLLDTRITDAGLQELKDLRSLQS